MLRPVLSLLTCIVPTVAAHQKQTCNMEILLSVLEVVNYEERSKACFVLHNKHTFTPVTQPLQ